jgi:hypothetical protein
MYERRQMCRGFGENLRETDHLENSNGGGRMILK